MSETAYLIWKIRNKCHIRNNDNQTADQKNKMINRWKNTINKRITIDRFLTNRSRFKERALDTKLIKATWKNCLNNEESLPTNWCKMTGVLVGISGMCPGGHVR